MILFTNPHYRSRSAPQLTRFLCWMMGIWLCASVYAQPASGNRFAVVNMKRIIDGAPQFAAGKQRVVQELAPIERTLRADEDKLAELKKKRAQQGAALPKTELDNLLRTIEASERAIKRGREDLNQRFTQRSNDVVRDLERQISEVIAQVAAEQGVDAVLSEQSTVYASPRLDLTDAVLTKLRANLSTR